MCDPCLIEAYGYDWRDLIPGTGWLRDYVKYCLSITDAPPVFHIASGLSILSTVLSGICTFKPTKDSKPFHLNTWILIGGTSAKQRKSTAVDMVDELLERNFSFLSIPWAGSPEAIYSQIAAQPQCVMVIPEFPSFLAQVNQKYAQSFKLILMDLYDGKTSQGRITNKRGQEIAKDPRVNMIGGAALPLLDKYLKDIDFRSGFLSRMIFVAGDRKKRLDRAREYPGTRERLQRQLFQLAQWAGRNKVINATKNGDAALCKLGEEVEKRAESVETAYQSLIGRADAHAHKVAALYALSMQNPAVYESLVKERVAPFIHYTLDAIEQYLIGLLSDSVFVRAAQQLKEYIHRSKYQTGDWIPFRNLVENSLDVRHAQAAVEQLVAEEIVSKPRTHHIEGTERDVPCVQLLRTNFQLI